MRHTREIHSHNKFELIISKCPHDSVVMTVEGQQRGGASPSSGTQTLGGILVVDADDLAKQTELKRIRNRISMAVNKHSIRNFG